MTRRTFLLPDGGRVEMDMGETRIRIDGQVRTSIVLFGEEGINPCGAYSLGAFLLGVDPVERRLSPVEGYLMAESAPTPGPSSPASSGRRSFTHRVTESHL